MKFRNLGRYSSGRSGGNMDLRIPPPRTPDGRVYRYSPNEAAQPRHFVLGDVKVDIPLTGPLRARMMHDPHTPGTVCPYTGVIAPDDAFWHPDDIKAAVEIVKHAALTDIQEEFSRTLQDIGRKSGGMIRVETSRSIPKPKPRFIRRDLMRLLVCDHCGRDYGVFAIGLFCPDCGAPNLRLHFAREAELVGKQVGLADGLGEGEEEFAYRLLGNAHEDVLTAFEATLKAVYRFRVTRRADGSPPGKAVSNDFQNIERGQKRFAEFDLDPYAGLSEAELETLRVNIQKRHLIGHNLGLVDDKFAAVDADAKVGETVHLVAEEVRLFAALCQKVVDQLDGVLAGTLSPTIGTQAPLVEMTERLTPDDPDGLMRLDLELSLLARKIGLWTASQSEGGMRELVGFGKLKAAFPDATEADLIEAVAELASDNFVHTMKTLQGLHSYRPELELYLVFDPLALETHPAADAVVLTEKVLGLESVSSKSLLAETGWARRRFNPALAYLLTNVDDGHISRTMDAEFAARFFHLSAEDKVALKRFVGRLKS